MINNIRQELLASREMTAALAQQDVIQKTIRSFVLTPDTVDFVYRARLPFGHPKNIIRLGKIAMDTISDNIIPLGLTNQAVQDSRSINHAFQQGLNLTRFQGTNNAVILERAQKIFRSNGHHSWGLGLLAITDDYNLLQVEVQELHIITAILASEITGHQSVAVDGLKIIAHLRGETLLQTLKRYQSLFCEFVTRCPEIVVGAYPEDSNITHYFANHKLPL